MKFAQDTTREGEFLANINNSPSMKVQLLLEDTLYVILDLTIRNKIRNSSINDSVTTLET